MNIVLADLHVKQRTWTNYSQLAQDAYEAIHKIQETIPESEADTAIICGDAFDINRPSSEDVSELLSFLSRFKSVLYIPGNHDSVQPSWLSLLNVAKGCDFVKQLSDEPCYMYGSNIPVYGCSEVFDRDYILGFLKSLPIEDGPAYVVLHTSFQHLLGHEEAWKLNMRDMVDIFGEKDVRVLVGHIHTREFKRVQGFGGYVYSPGSLFPCSWDKVSELPTFAELTNTGDIVEHDCAVRSYHTHNYVDGPTLDAFVTDVVANNHYVLKPMIRVIVPTGVSVTIQQNTYPDALLQCVSEVAANVTDTPIVQTAGAVTTLQQAVIDELSDDGLMRPLATALLESDDPVATVGSWIDYWKVERSTNA